MKLTHDGLLKWTKKNHYGLCGQSCPCCRYQNGEVFGYCGVCKYSDILVSSHTILVNLILDANSIHTDGGLSNHILSFLHDHL